MTANPTHTPPANVLPLRPFEPIAGALPSHALDAEAAVLSALWLTPGVLDSVRFLAPEHFFAAAHQWMFRASVAIVDAGGCPDGVTVANWLRGQGRLAEVGGIPGLMRTVDSAPCVANVVEYATIVYEAAQVRALEEECRRLLHQCRGAIPNHREFLTQATTSITEVAKLQVHGGEPASIGEIVRAQFEALRDGAMRGSLLAGTPTGFRDFDAMTTGMRAGELWILGARPGAGKTSLAMNIAVNVAAGTEASLGPTVLVFSLEMTRQALGQRVLCSEARVDAQAMRHGRIPQGQWEDLVRAAQFFQTLPLAIDDTKGLTVYEIKARTMHQKAQLERLGERLGLVIVDYLQLVAPRVVKGRNREQEVAEVSRELKALSGQAGCPVLALVQISREVEKQNRAPRGSDIRDSGQVEQDADLIAFLTAGKDTPKGASELLIVKQRNGATGGVLLGWAPAFTSFTNYDPHGAPPPDWAIGTDLGGAS